MNSKVWDANGTHPVDTFWPGRFLKFPSNDRKAEFSMAGKESSWLPFGSGANLCPGRQFAKDLKMDLTKFGMGVLGPNGKVGARLQRRQTKI
jgi:hypothetical protein